MLNFGRVYGQIVFGWLDFFVVPARWIGPKFLALTEVGDCCPRGFPEKNAGEFS